MKKVLILLFAFFATPALAETIAITGGKVYTVSGPNIDGGTVVIEDGVITAVGADVEIPEGARIIDARGKHVTPGIMNSSTTYGLSEGAAGKFSSDSSANNSGMTASFDVRYALNSGSVIIQEGRRQGVTRAVSSPTTSGDIFSGSSALITMDNRTDMHFAEGAMHAKFGNAGNRAVAWNRIRAIFDQVLDYDRNRTRAMRGQAQDYMLSYADMDALVPVASPFQRLDMVTLSHLSDAFAGRITNWSEMGGDDLAITLHLPPADDGMTQRLLDTVVTSAGPITYHESRDAMLEAVAADRGALGISSYTDTGISKPLTLQDQCGFVAVPRLTSLKTEDYPLTAPLFLYLPERRLPPIARDFLRFLRLPQAQLIVRRANFVDQGAIPIAMDAQGQRFANAIAAAGPEIDLGELQRMVRILLPRTRLSTSFRFKVGSTRLDAQSRSNLLALGQAIRDGVYDDRALMLVGFSDGRGAALANRDLSSARAEAVLRDLTSLLGGIPPRVQIETEAFGEALPMGCDDTEWGRQMNRRVELWVSE